MQWMMWVLPPVLGAGIGYVTNWLAIKMLFHPRRPRFGLQGLLPRRQADLAKSVGAVVGDELVQIDRILEPLARMDLRPHFETLIDEAIADKVQEWQTIPLLGAFLTPKRFHSIRNSVVDELVRKQPQILQTMKDLAMQHIDVGKMAEERIASFELTALERVVHRVAAKEFRAIEIWGAVLGFIIGLAQAGLFIALGAGAAS